MEKRSMKALVLETGGSIDGFCEKEKAIPSIRDDELLVRVHSVALNSSDYQTAEHIQGDQLDLVLGLDVAGVVEKAGKDCDKFKKGDRVFYLREIGNPNGGFGEYAVTPERFVCRIPDNLDDDIAAALPGAGFTAYHIMFQRFHLKEGKTILIHGGAGGVGSYAIQLAKMCGLRILTTCQERDRDYVLKLGADAAIDYQKENVYNEILNVTNGCGVDYVVNTIGRAEKDMEILRFGGELAVTSGLPDFSQWKFYDRGLSVHEIAFGVYMTYPDAAVQRVPAEVAGKLSDLVSKGAVCAPHLTKIALSEVPEWLGKMKAGQVFGKVVAGVGTK